MGWPELIVFVRHGESAGNVLTVEERAAFEQPTHAYPLTERGRRQAEITGAYVRERFRPFDVCWSSYYRRAKETAALVFHGKVYEDARLAEGQRGIYHTYTRDELMRYFPKEIERKKREGLYHHRPIGGENWPDIELRIHSFLGTLARDGDGKRVLIVGHGHWLILFQKLLEHFGIEEAERRYREGAVANASVTMFEGFPRKTSVFTRLVENKGMYAVPWKGILEENPLTVAPPV